MMESVSTHCLIVVNAMDVDPSSSQFVDDAHALGLETVTAIRVENIYHLEGDLSSSDLKLIAESLLVDPVVQSYHWREDETSATDLFVETSPRPGVTDTAAFELLLAAHSIGIDGLERVATGKRFVVAGGLDRQHLDLLAKRLLVNSVVERYGFEALEAIYPTGEDAEIAVATVALVTLSDSALLDLSKQRGLSLDLAEMQTIAAHFSILRREPSDAELEMLAQTWSEHCVHKTFKAKIEFNGETIDGLFDTYIKAATTDLDVPWVRSVFVDDAGIIEFDDDFDVSYKVETHNHPSAIEPFGGANTGVGGVVRDILGVSARPIAITNILCFGLADTAMDDLAPGVLHPRRIRSGVVAGVGDYGNKIGVPTVAGAVIYHEDYTRNPLVFAGCVGLAPKDSHPVGAQPGDHVIVIGGGVGRDGIGGATFSSRTTGSETIDDAGSAVQIGNPIIEKGLIEVVTRARDAGLYSAITDCGAGGLSSSVGEMAETIGADIDLAKVPLKYAGLQPWEIWLSEAQERMVLSAPDPGPIERLCEIYEIGFANIGTFSNDGRIKVRHDQLAVIDLDCEFLHEGLPQRRMLAVPSALKRRRRQAIEIDAKDALLKLLAHPSIASNEDIVRTYDHEVMGGTAVRPYQGVSGDGPSDGTAVVPIGTTGDKAVVLGIGVNAFFGRLDAYRMARSVLDEAVRNVVATGANPDRIALLDNFSWGDPTQPTNLGSLVEACRGCYDGAISLGGPFISGKDSLYNEYVGADGSRHPIPPTLVVSALAIIDDVADAVTTDLKQPDDVVFLVGETKDELGGSHLDDVLDEDFDGEVPAAVEDALELYHELHSVMGLVTACHDLSEGGLAVAAAEMCVAGRLGLELEVSDDFVVQLFSESNSRFLVTVAPENVDAFSAALSRVLRLGRVTAELRLNISCSHSRLDLTIDEILTAGL